MIRIVVDSSGWHSRVGAGDRSADYRRLLTLPTENSINSHTEDTDWVASGPIVSVIPEVKHDPRVSLKHMRKSTKGVRSDTSLHSVFPNPSQMAAMEASEGVSVCSGMNDIIFTNYFCLNYRIFFPLKFSGSGAVSKPTAHSRNGHRIKFRDIRSRPNPKDQENNTDTIRIRGTNESERLMSRSASGVFLSTTRAPLWNIDTDQKQSTDLPHRSETCISYVFAWFSKTLRF